MIRAIVQLHLDANSSASHSGVSEGTNIDRHTSHKSPTSCISEEITMRNASYKKIVELVIKCINPSQIVLMDFNAQTPQKTSFGVDECWDNYSSEQNIGFDSSDSTTAVSTSLYRTLSETGLEPSQIDSPAGTGNLRNSLQRQLNNLRPAKSFVSSVSRLISEMTSAISTYLDKSASLVPYGSIASNLCLNGSTIDVLVFIPPELFASQFGNPNKSSMSHPEIPLGMMKEFELRQSMRRALGRISELFTVFCGLCMLRLTNVVPATAVSVSSRVPVLTMNDPVSGVKFDIVCNTVLPLFSTRLVKSYNSLVPTGELRDFILLVKYWAGRRRILGSGNGELSGYAWTLLCIFYCQCCLEVMPSLQSLARDRQQWTDPFGSNRRCDVGFEDDRRVPTVVLPDSISLFMGFVDFLANYWNWNSGVVSVRLGRVASIESSEVFLRQPVIDRTNGLFIEDPFDIKKDLCTSSLDRLRDEIIESALLLSAGGTIGSLMSPSTQSQSAPSMNRRRPNRAESTFC